MNIGETDADGWTYVRFGDAAKAAQEGVHECQMRVDDAGWIPADLFSVSGWQYRIREKARTITVTIPRPYSPSFSHNNQLIGLSYQSFSDAQATYKAICKAMEQS